MIDASEFRRVLGHFATGVTVVTSCRGDGSPCGLTVSAVSSLSLEPRLILACVDAKAESHGCVREAGCFAINVLDASTGEVIARRFGISGAPDKFDQLGYRTAITGSPLLDDALAWMDCRVVESHAGGDHSIFIGEVLAADARAGEPLLYYRGRFGRFVS